MRSILLGDRTGGEKGAFHSGDEKIEDILAQAMKNADKIKVERLSPAA